MATIKQNKRVGFLGPAGTFTEQALKIYSQGEGVEAIPYPNIAQIFSGIEQGQIREGIVPVENSLEGSVNITLDLLGDSRTLKIKGEVVLPVEQWLLLPKAVELSQVTVVYSHAQALGQCQASLEKLLPGLECRECASTAAAVSMVADAGQPWAAIGSRQLGLELGLQPYHQPLTQAKDNFTRFWVVGLEEAQPTGRDKTTLVFSLQDQPGGLHVVLQEFAQLGINLTKIESRPAKTRLGEYIFFVDLVGHYQDAVVAQVLHKVAKHTTNFNLLGSYPQANQLESPTQQKALAGLRQEIDLVDQEIVQLLARRTTLVSKIGHLKSGVAPVQDSNREKQILQRLQDLAVSYGLDPGLVTKVYKELFKHFVALQRKQQECDE